MQEEAPSLGKPVFVMRDKTERPEGVAAGCITMVGNRSDRIVAVLADHLDHGMRPSGTANPYGDGLAAMRIADAVLKTREGG